LFTTVLTEIASYLPIAARTDLEGCVANVLKQFRRRYIYPWLKPLYPYKQATLAGTRVSYKNHLDGGGRGFGQDFIPLLLHYSLPRQARAFEWCAGPGFIGFSLLAHGLCETLCLADINPEAVQACQCTIADNALSDRASVYCSDNLRNIPPTEQWDLVVSNPPHFIDDSDPTRKSYPGLRCHECQSARLPLYDDRVRRASAMARSYPRGGAR
jgi:Methyltransferase small domain